MIKAPASYAFDWIGNKIKEGVTDIALNYISALPIIIGVAIGVYALVGMISSRLAKLGVIGVFVYGAFVVIL